ncbi:AraC family transcriptional regulator [Pleomorphovibrio marinus]|uniref:AraC family transcriptional regulator n=1 Tax=Pleomorphovibrio marinus TaxID=2164132 RepID=UPI0013008092|nr:helix-turn-helix domain-containing protein [Pleomorphovibrio marinus]
MTLGQVRAIDLRHYSNEHGLELPMVNDLFLNADGYLWLSTLGGLVRFDGTDFLSFEPEGRESKSINFTCAVSDEKGTIYAIGQDRWDQKHLFSLQPDSGVLVPVENSSLFPMAIKALLPSNSGEFLVISLDEQIYQYAEGKLKWVFKSPDQIPIINVKINQKEFLVQNSHHEIFIVDQEVNSKRLDPDELPSIEPVHFDGDEKIIGSLKVDIEEEQFFTAQPSLLPSPVYPFQAGKYFRFHQESRNVTWILKNKSIFCHDNNSGDWKDFSDLLKDFPKAQGIKCALVDPFDQVWIGTNDGIFALKPSFSISKSLFTKKDHLGNAFSFRGITEWRGQIYANSYSGKVNYDPSGEEESLFYKSKVDVHKLAAHCSNDTSLWLGEGQKLLRFYDPNTPPHTYPLPSLEPFPYKSLEIWAISEDTLGKVWIGTNAGLAVLDSPDGPIRFLSSPSNPSQPVAKINHIHPTKNGLILATSLGIRYFDFVNGFQIENRQHLLLEKLTEGISIYHLHFDKNGDMWLASHGEGLMRWNSDFSLLNKFGSSSGFSNKHLHAIYEDHKGRMWIPSENGLFLFYPDELRAIRFGKANGLSDEEFNRISHFRAKDGTMYFGGVAGINVINPSDFYQTHPDTIQPLALGTAQLTHSTQKKSEDISLAVKEQNPIPLNGSTTGLTLTLLNLGGFGEFEYKWKEEDTAWQKTDATQISLTKFPNQADELLIRAIDDVGQIKGYLALPLHFQQDKKGWGKLPLWLSGIVVAAGVCFILYRQKIDKNTLPIHPTPKPTFIATQSVEEPIDGFVEKLEEIVRKNISSPEFGVTQLSEALYVSRKSLYRKTNQLLGKNPNEIIKEIRLEYARNLLSIAELNIAEITYKSGFGSSSYFSNCYKKHFGLTPKEYRKQLSQEKKRA